MSSAESIKFIENIVRAEVQQSALQSTMAGDMPGQHEMYVKRICDSLWDGKSKSWPSEDQKRLIQDLYTTRLEACQPKLKKYLDDTELIFKIDNSLITALSQQTEISSDQSTVEESYESQEAKDRDEAARNHLGDRYFIFEQYQKGVVTRRAQAPGPFGRPIDFKDIPAENGKKKCPWPGCPETLSSNGIKRHYQQMHAKDPTKSIFCPFCPHTEYRGDSTIEKHLKNKHPDFYQKIAHKLDKRTRKKSVPENGAREVAQSNEGCEMQGVEDEGDEALGYQEMEYEEMADALP
ncbi:hypothetical protein N8I77_002215 [Diaporthe amygdali]|uniref:Uncharacterized protein n=1 Tax=Phomopsis amygdali TaxID=1214568 RepID=A0AAD9STG8_PHOAM|nr:hypothetical protein N8I77_002215 [Diaporthe amygdali]